ncbi:hypothetical protein [Chryseobacterium pennipullorum]|uniref:Uncharacterized protein n=1 Tax=Chryseobacterium pennipullorum TaxID=2258963 RepID=A0A3D9B8F3_9FLAO|nr:hypothetical protein [Chryseobacterium pennipullorum]REC49647.1 hypothetical protein DRF67_04055 [Chryseobacterium pennipullorum]
MKNIYRSYNEEDLLIAYLYMVDHTGTINNEMLEAINQKFNYNDFVKKADYRKLLIKEKGRISFEIHNRVQEGKDIDFIMENISSEIMDEEGLKVFILEKFSQFSKVKENNKIDKKTVYKCLLGIVIASVIGTLILDAVILFTAHFSFFLLVPVYIINYFVIRIITGKTRDNLIVFLAVLISVIVSTVLSLVYIM